MPTARRGIAQQAARPNPHRFGNLYELIHAELLRPCGRDSNTNAAYGVERISAEADAPHLANTLRDLVERRKRQTYRAKLVRRPDIPTGDGRMRPLGIPAIEAKLVQ